MDLCIREAKFFHRVPKSFPATDGKRVYFGSDNGTFWALDAFQGTVDWEFKVHTDGKKNIWSAPAVHDGFVYFGAYDGNVYCLESDTGAEIWRFTEADFVGSSPALAPDLGLLFIGLEFAVPGKQGSIVALDLRSGSKVWEHSTSAGTSKPTAQVHFKIDRLAAHSLELSDNNSRLDQGLGVALRQPEQESPDSRFTTGTWHCRRGPLSEASLDGSAPYPYHVGSGRPSS